MDRVGYSNTSFELQIQAPTLPIMDHSSSSRKEELQGLLLEAIVGGDFCLADALLSQGMSINGSVRQNIPPLSVATIRGSVHMVEFLIKRGADVEVVTPRDLLNEKGLLVAYAGTSPLHFAVQRGVLDIIRVLLRAGANPNSLDAKCNTPLTQECTWMTAVYSASQRTAIVRELLEAGANPTLPNQYGFVALHFAAFIGDLETMKLLLSQGPGALNKVAANRRTPLYCAADNGHEEAVFLLLSAGASNKKVFEEPGDMGVACPLVAAASEGHDGVVRVLVDRGLEAVGGSRALSTAVLNAVHLGRARVLHMLFSVLAEEAKRCYATSVLRGYPVLHLSVAHGRLAMTSLLLSAGADEKAIDSLGGLPDRLIGKSLPPEQRTPRLIAALRRLLARGPAFRARSWLWADRYCGKAGAVVASSDPKAEGRSLKLARMKVFRKKDRWSCGRCLARYSNKR